MNINHHHEQEHVVMKESWTQTAAILNGRVCTSTFLRHRILEVAESELVEAFSLTTSIQHRTRCSLEPVLA